MDIYGHYRTQILEALSAVAKELGKDQDISQQASRFAVEPTREAAHGDIASNVAMIAAKPLGLKPQELAKTIAERLHKLVGVVKVDIAGPGFLNLTLKNQVWLDRINDILAVGDRWGCSDFGRKETVNIEYVSANPTGPLTAGHARGAVVGDALAALLQKTGYNVVKEYYINDAGNQVLVLAQSAYLRYREALGEKIEAIPSGLYPGEYLKDVGQALARRDGRRWLDTAEVDWLPVVRQFTIDFLLAEIKEDLHRLGIQQDVFSSEAALVRTRRVEEAIKILQDNDLIYEGILEPPKGKTPDDWEPRPQTLFRATKFGDDTDRPLKKSDGTWTYFASDIAYHFDKFHRGAQRMIDVWGADHGGYIKRMQAAVTAVTNGKAALDVKICQMVRVLDKGEPVKMSKRAGTFVTLRDVIDAVGKDVIRFIMLTRKNDAPLDFDYAKVTEQSRDNPVFYVQYAHARAYSALRMAAEAFPGIDLSPESLRKAPLERLTDSEELTVVKLIAGWPRLLETAAQTHEPHRPVFYLLDIAAAFHGLWTKGKENPDLRFVVHSDRALTEARLAMVRAVAYTIASGLRIVGVEPLEEMR